MLEAERVTSPTRAACATSEAPHRRVLGMRVDATTYQDATSRVLSWARASEGRSVCIASVNNVMQAHDDPSFQRVMDRADLVTPDGMPLAWGLRLLGVEGAERVCGTDLVPHLLRTAERAGLPLGLYGGEPRVIEALVRKVTAEYPRLRIVLAESPPWTPPSQEDQRLAWERINASGARLVLVGLGCPKQERWMAEARDNVRAVMVGVGAAFDFIVGAKRRAPALLQRLGMEWTYRLAREPRRLWRRYLGQNPRFIVLFGRQLCVEWISSVTSRSQTEVNPTDGGSI